MFLASALGEFNLLLPFGEGASLFLRVPIITSGAGNARAIMG